MIADDSNEEETNEGESDDYVERETVDEDEKEQEHQHKIPNDRLDDDDNESDLGKSTKLFVPYWDPYDTVNQLFLEISKYIRFSVSSSSKHHLLACVGVFRLLLQSDDVASHFSK